MTEHTNTPEVRIKLWDEGDLGLLRQLNSPEMTVHFGGPETEEKILARHKRYHEIAQKGIGRMFKILLLPHLEVVGSVGYWDQIWQGESIYEVGWSVLPDYQGGGIATKATELAIASINSEKKHKFIHAFPKINNPASNAICRKLGFSFMSECDFEYPIGTIIRCNDWRLTVEENE
ncbi:GNAT family N-acetyltransferase [Paenibacillus sp. HJL G12]|uniref:GNAT family N-acetyltransferase n=1 Tax=Paenibacillus dendrobii TaxID=2691084 RepID=A0A7X3IP53_9BACL|nr:GNAT family N-acetyltransferase [Paenibacillus dendrobii]MWV47113.1 GNAT family N-acetyltransferase [Paenibacillus dendrobii]